MARSRGRILIVDDEVELLRLSKKILNREGYSVKTAHNAETALSLLETEGFNVILLDLIMPGMGGIRFLEDLKRRTRREEVIVLTAHANIDSAVQAIKLGAYGYLSKPLDVDAILVQIQKIIELQNLRLENISLQRQRGKTAGLLIGQNEKMIEIYQQIGDIGPTPVPVLIRGQSGTGKELAAKAIHCASDRVDKPFVRFNCAALAPGVLESELFGHVRGAFTGAVRDRKGRFQEADGGTLFLDEIGDLGIEMQIRFLRVLQEGEFEPVGSTETQKVDVRFISATHKNLEKEIEEGRFREDLYYRINTMTIEMPALNERTSDIPLLCMHLLEQNNLTLNKKIRGITPAALNCLERYSWPGNVREMENIILRAMALAKGEEIDLEHFPLKIQATTEQIEVPQDHEQNLVQSDSLYEIPEILFHPARKHFEEIFIYRALQKTHGNISRAAEVVQLGRRNLQRKIKEFQIDMSHFDKLST